VTEILCHQWPLLKLSICEDYLQFVGKEKKGHDWCFEGFQKVKAVPFHLFRLQMQFILLVCLAVITFVHVVDQSDQVNLDNLCIVYLSLMVKWKSILIICSVLQSGYRRNFISPAMSGVIGIITVPALSVVLNAAAIWNSSPKNFYTWILNSVGLWCWMVTVWRTFAWLSFWISRCQFLCNSSSWSGPFTIQYDSPGSNGLQSYRLKTIVLGSRFARTTG
jgi:hypothetical protein